MGISTKYGTKYTPAQQARIDAFYAIATTKIVKGHLIVTFGNRKTARWNVGNFSDTDIAHLEGHIALCYDAATGTDRNGKS